MENYDTKIIAAIDNAIFNLIDRFNNKLPLEILGKVVKDLLMEEKIYFKINSKRVSPNNYIKKNYKSFSKFINLKTNYKIINEKNYYVISI